MRERLIKTELANYIPSEWSGTNNSGYFPVGERVLVKCDKASDQLGNSGKLVMTEKKQEDLTLGTESGVIVAMGDDAFIWNMDRTRRYEGAKPKVGDRVLFRRYSGQLITGLDGDDYRYMSDNCIGMIEYPDARNQSETEDQAA